MSEQSVIEPDIVEPGDELEVVPAARIPAKVVGGIPYFNEYLMLAEKIAWTGMVPRDLNGKPDEVLAVIMYGAELGIGPMQALQQINFIANKPSASAELLRALVMEAGHQFILTATDEVATAQCKRRDWKEWKETTFTLADATRAGLSGDNWRKYPDQMLSARVTSKACRMWFADVISGMSYTPEEVESFDPPPAVAPVEPVETPHEVLYRRLMAEVVDADPEASKARRKAFVERVTGKTMAKFADLTPDEVADLLYALDHEPVEMVTVDGRSYPKGQEPFAEGEF